ncbi:MAG: hypothetical protein KDB53_14850 [Planctomycetes bacterium]|nr:hypothetical protein [Planctomycetota bacterium]
MPEITTLFLFDAEAHPDLDLKLLKHRCRRLWIDAAWDQPIPSTGRVPHQRRSLADPEAVLAALEPGATALLAAGHRLDAVAAAARRAAIPTVRP